MSDLKPPRGTHDILPEEHRRHRHVGETALAVANLYGFEEMSTPIFESIDVFRRTLGETSDVVTKEMYTFTDKGGDEVTLRPENTAGIARCFISEGLAHSAPFKVFYSGPMFRYERPQKGRLRQFHQIGVETFGIATPDIDAEVILLTARLWKELGLSDQVTLELNTLGDNDDRARYREALVAFLREHRERSLASGMNAHIPKPVEMSVLREALVRFTRKDPGAADGDAN